MHNIHHVFIRHSSGWFIFHNNGTLYRVESVPGHVSRIATAECAIGVSDDGDAQVLNQDYAALYLGEVAKHAHDTVRKLKGAVQAAEAKAAENLDTGLKVGVVVGGIIFGIGMLIGRALLGGGEEDEERIIVLFPDGGRSISS